MAKQFRAKCSILCNVGTQHPKMNALKLIIVVFAN